MKEIVMKSVVTAVLCLIFAVGVAYAEDQMSLKTQKEKVSYIIGTDIGNNFKKQGIDIDPDILIKGLKDSLNGSKLVLSEKEIGDVMTAFKQEFAAKQAEISKIQGEKNKKEGEAFLTENKKKEGVKTLQSGLQYKIITEGTGRSPKATDTVTVNYKGTLIDGTEFDSSYKRGQAASFPVKGVITGWTEALQLMKEGAKWELFVPSNLAYGDKGTVGGPIGPNATLVFEVELISIK
jgi:FKBP-type peptidyl-prolyl cis-trans isomerase FklB